MREFNLTQLISEPTHLTEDSSSILDLILVRNKTNIIFSGVIDPFTPEQVRYHFSTIVLLKFLRPRTAAYKGEFGIINFPIMINTDSS